MSTRFTVLRAISSSGLDMKTAGFSRSGPITWGLLLIIAVVAAFSIMPIIWFDHLPLADYPNHLARLQIHKSLSSDPYLSKFFYFRWIFIPNLGLDLLTWPWIFYIPVELAGRITIIVSLLMIYIGTILLDRQLNGDNWGLSLFAGLFLYNGPFRFGFINYIIGIGFAMCTLWIWVRYRQKSTGVWLGAFTFLAFIVLCMHLAAFGILAVCVAGVEASLFWKRLKAERRLSISLFKIPTSASASLIIPCLCLLWFSPISNSPGRHIWVYGIAAPNGWFIEFVRKIEGLAAPIFYSDPVVEKPLLLIIFILFAWALATRTIVPNSLMIFPLVVFAVLFLIMPFELLGSEFADYRLPSGVAFIALASFGWGKTSPARRNLFCILLGVCLLVRVGSIMSNWQPAQAIIQEYHTALQLVAPGSRLLVYVAPIRGAPRTWSDRNPPLRMVPVLAAAKHSVFDPDTFANEGLMKGSQLLDLKADYRDYWLDDPPNNSRLKDIKRYDYLIAIRGRPANDFAGVTLKEIRRGTTFVLYRIEQAGVSAPEAHASRSRVE